MLVSHGIEIQEIFEQIKKTLQFVDKFEQISDFISQAKLINTDNFYYIFEQGKSTLFNLKP